jgi:5'-nucleotidase
MGQINKTIQVLVTAGLAASAMVMGTGCADTTAPSQSTALHNDVTDVRPMASATPAGYQVAAYDNSGVVPTAPQPITPPPAPVVSSTPTVASDSYSPMLSVTPTGKTVGQKTHKVVKGETLFSIAKAAYGSGKQWKNIVAANPGLTPSKLKVGQTIVMPS